MSNRFQYITVRSLALRQNIYLELIGNRTTGTIARFSRVLFLGSLVCTLRFYIAKIEALYSQPAIAAFNNRRWYRVTNIFFSFSISLSFFLSFAAVNYSLVFQRPKKDLKRKLTGFSCFSSYVSTYKMLYFTIFCIAYRDAKCFPVIIIIVRI